MSGLSEEVALRIALAARALPDIEIRVLLEGLLDIVNGPLIAPKLNKLRLGKLKRLEALAEVDDAYLKDALGYLKGQNIKREPDPLPDIQLYQEGDMPGSIRVACASNGGDKIDGHFGSCRHFLIYQIAANEQRLVDIRKPGPVHESEDKNKLRAELIADCQLLYTVSVGGPAAAKVVRAGIHPIKLPLGGQAPEVLNRLQSAISSNPPPWLAKVMGYEPAERVRFQEEATG